MVGRAWKNSLHHDGEEVKKVQSSREVVGATYRKLQIHGYLCPLELT